MKRYTNSQSAYRYIASVVLAGCLFLSLTFCADVKSSNGEQHVQGLPNEEQVVAVEQTFRKVSDIPPPEGFARVESHSGDFTGYLRQFPLDTLDNVVHLYNGEEKYNQAAQYRILDIDVGERDLQQCADAVMRLQAEFLFDTGREEDISFQFTNGDDVPFSKYAAGYRPTINGNNVTWHKVRQEDHSHQTFRKYMDLIFTYAGSYSLSQQLNPVADVTDIRPGDVFIQGGFPGHAVIVMDVVEDSATGEKCFMLAQSYMPAQEIHILKNPEDERLSPWYKIPGSDVIRTPEWTFITHDLMRFSNL